MTTTRYQREAHAGEDPAAEYADSDYVVLGEATDGGEVALSHMKVGGLTKGQSVVINADTFPGAHVFRYAHARGLGTRAPARCGLGLP